MKHIYFLLLLYSHSFINIYPQWINQNPVPNGNDLWSTFFIDANTGWIVGSEGFIKKTTNAGFDWVEQTSVTTLTLRSIQFINQETGWICGEGGLIIKTTDGGLNWFSLMSGTSELLTDIYFYDLDTGYIVGYGETILKTTNGGSLWVIQSSGASYDLFSVDFVDAFIGFAVGKNITDPYAKILKTTDGGDSWIDKSFEEIDPSPIYAVEFIDANTGFVGGGFLWVYNFIYKTTDGGDTWIQTPLPPLKQQEINNRKQLSIYESGGINSIYFKDSNIGYAVGGFHNGWERQIFSTTDGGSTWIQKYYGNEEDGLLSVYGNDTGKAWAVGFTGAIFITEDDGNSWAQIFSGDKSSQYNGDDIYSVFCINDSIGWAAGKRDVSEPPAGDVILKTTNGGKIWKTQLFLQASGGPTRSVYFINENIGWAAGDEALYRTTDGGENWISNGMDGCSDIFFINQDTGWVVLETSNIYEDAIFKTTDGGLTWTPKSTQSSSSVFFANANSGWAVGESGSILKSTDGGESWVSKTSGTTNDLNSVKFYNSNLGMCVGTSGTVLLSTNSGENWILQIVGTTEALTAVGFTNSTTIWIAGSNGTIINTTDLGNNWSFYEGVTENDLTSLCFINENTGWIGGMNGTMFKYSTEPSPLTVWTNQIIVEDAGGMESSEVLIFGQHVDATDSIDASLGEYELPPPPPPSVFDSRFILPTIPQVSSFKDLRDSNKTEITWTMTFQPGSAGYPMIFSWDSLSFPAGTIYLKDRINGSIVNVNMKNQSSYVLTNPAITSLNINYKGEFCSVVSVNNEWNMISVPYLAEDMALGSLYPTATSFAYGYENGYVMEDTLIAGVGYWLKFGGNEEIQICGVTLGDTLQVETGWNLFGVYEKDLPVSQLTTTPPGIIATYFFGYEDGYYIADTLKAGKGYWVRVTSDGILNLNSGALSKDIEEGLIAEVEQEWGKIKISDNEGKSITLYASEEEIELGQYELPPIPPSGMFDARYGSGKFVEDLSSVIEILIRSDNYPITIKAEGINLTVRDKINGEILNEELNNGEEIRIINNLITSIEVTGRITGQLPVSYELYQNYPNPFNPNTLIKFSIAKEAQVNLIVFNILGEKVQELKNEIMKPGHYEVEFNALSLASGIYLYKIYAGDFVQTKKMVLLK